jgi:prepilin-type N-terminal cleavage/methylation domain-containing protein
MRADSNRIRRPAGILPRTARARAESGRRSALTLLELLVVIAIASVLIAILIPSLRGARDQARSVACRSNLRQLMHGMLLYATDDGALPGTHTLFHMQRLFGAEWPRPAGVTWDGARDRIVDFNVTAPYEKPYDRDPEFRAHVPRRGTLFPYIQSENTYRCPADRPGPVDDSPRGGGGNGRLSYALNGYVGYQPPERLGQFTYVAPAPNNPLPNTDATRSFDTGQRVIFAPARFMTMFEEHPKYHLNAAFPDGNFNGLDRVATAPSGNRFGASTDQPAEHRVSRRTRRRPPATCRDRRAQALRVVRPAVLLACQRPARPTQRRRIHQEPAGKLPLATAGVIWIFWGQMW